MLIGHTCGGDDVGNRSEEEPGQDVCRLVFSANGEDLDQSILHVFAKVVVTHVDVLDARAQLWESHEL